VAKIQSKYFGKCGIDFKCKVKGKNVPVFNKLTRHESVLGMEV
jgi:hypothetical protein